MSSSKLLAEAFENVCERRLTVIYAKRAATLPKDDALGARVVG